ncbi:hypothetical protein [Nocardia sp. NPDC020380]|uniref:hypothetical protein n=1 Tax=Nocardia sp. NPDC020380 TaxID=3364309 RepID=UPI003790CB76
MHRRWKSSSWSKRLPLAAAVTAVVALVAACGGNSPSGSSQGSSTPQTSSSAPTTSSGVQTGTPGTPLQVSDAVAQQLCDLIKPQLSDWRVQGPTLGKISLNASVHEWGLRNGGINIQILNDKEVVDRVMTKQCPDTHTQALQALELQTLASGLAF